MDKRELTFNFKTMMMFEKLSGQSYFKISEDNYVYMLYAMYMAKHPETYMTVMDFANIFGNNKKVTKQMLKEFGELMDYTKQYMENSNKETKKDKGGKEDESSITDIAMYLITVCGIDPHYVMYEMELWEIEPYMKFAERNKREELEQQRLWTYMGVMPHIDTKKCKSPDKLLTFPWEVENQKAKAETELKNNEYAIKNMIGKSIFGDKDEQ